MYLNTTDKNKWITNQLAFLKPLLIVLALTYVGNLTALLSTPGHIVSWNDFIPTGYQVTAMVLYVTNALYDLLRKLQ